MLRPRLNLFKVMPVDIGASLSRAIDLQTGQLLLSDEMVDETIRSHAREYFRQGVVVRPTQLRQMLEVLLRPIWRPRWLLQPTLVTSIFAQSSEVEREILSDTLYQLGARKVVLFPTPLVAALGSGISFSDTSGSLILHLGQSFVEASLISLGGLIANEVSFFAGSHLDQQIHALARQKYHLLLSTEALRMIKYELLDFNVTNQTQLIEGKDITSGQLNKKRFLASDFQPLLIHLADKYLVLVRAILKQAPVGLVVSALEKGMILSGGLANIAGLADYLTKQLDFPVLVTEKSELNVINGLSQIGKNLTAWQPLAFSDQSTA